MLSKSFYTWIFISLLASTVRLAHFYFVTGPGTDIYTEGRNLKSWCGRNNDHRFSRGFCHGIIDRKPLAWRLGRNLFWRSLQPYYGLAEYYNEGESGDCRYCVEHTWSWRCGLCIQSDLWHSKPSASGNAFCANKYSFAVRYSDFGAFLFEHNILVYLSYIMVIATG